MDRNQFLKSLAIWPLMACKMKINDLEKITAPLSLTEEKMPVLFLGHGSPMNAIEDNTFVQGFRKIGQQLKTPKAILCISAHWETKGTYITAMEHPKTIHDFGGFPQSLFEVQYPAPGSPSLAKETQSIVQSTHVELDYNWGLDHGAWSVIKHLYPQANVPVLQMSIDYTQPPAYHYALAKELATLRNKGVLIIGSGNIVHNLGMIAWDKLSGDPYAYDWAIEASDKMKHFILNRQHDALVNYQSHGKAFQYAIPSPEHYIPLLYTLALQSENEEPQLFNDLPVAGSLTMTSVMIGAV